MAKAAQASALFVAIVVISLPVLIMSVVSCSWPDEAFLRPSTGLLGYVELLVRMIAVLALAIVLIVFHKATLASFRTSPMALPNALHMRIPAIFAYAPALRHLLTLTLTGSVMVPSFAVLCHGFRLSTATRRRIAPSWNDLDACLLVGALVGATFSVVWHSVQANVLQVSNMVVPYFSRSRLELARESSPLGIVLLFGALYTTVICTLISTPGQTGAYASSVAEDAAIALDLSDLRRWWIVFEAMFLSTLTWVVSSVVVSTVLTQPYSFVDDDSASATDTSNQRISSGNPSNTSPTSKLDGLMFALTAHETVPAADPTGLLALLSMQDLYCVATSNRARRAPIFADPKGGVWHDVLAASLAPVDQLTYRLWLLETANQSRSELPTMFSPETVDSSALYRMSGGRYLPGPMSGVVARYTASTTLFGDHKRVVYASGAIAALSVASKTEDVYGVSQRTLVDVITSLVQCRAKVVNATNSQRVMIGNRPRGISTASIVENPRSVLAPDADGQRAIAVQEALEKSIRELLGAFRDHIAAYLHNVEPRWDPRLNSELLEFLSG